METAKLKKFAQFARRSLIEQVSLPGVNNRRQLFNTADGRVSRSGVSKFYVCCDSVWENHKADFNGSSSRLQKYPRLSAKGRPFLTSVVKGQVNSG